MFPACDCPWWHPKRQQLGLAAVAGGTALVTAPAWVPEQRPALISLLLFPGQHQLVAGSCEDQERGAGTDLEEIRAVGNHRAALQ